MPTHVPEAFLIGTDDKILYRGAIDNAFASPGKPRAQTTEHYLKQAINEVIAGRHPTRPQIRAIGCIFEPWQKGEDGKSLSLLEPVTYAKHISPILDANCVSCHRSGQVAPFVLNDFTSAKRKARTIVRVCSDGFMPPWNAEIGYGSFIGQRFITQRQIAALTDWVKGGRQQGDVSERGLAPVFPDTKEWPLGQPDLVLTLPEPFLVPADGADIYRHFVLPARTTEDKALVAIDFRPGAAEVVHHVIINHDKTGKARALDRKDKLQGYDPHSRSARRKLSNIWGIDVIESIAGWAPGQLPFQLPEGVAQKLPAGGDLVIEVHYHPNGQAQADQSQVALYFAKKPIKHYAISFVAGTEKIKIPANEADYRRHVWVEIPTDLTIYDVVPHMHLLGQEFIVEATLPNGEKVPLNWIKHWDFRWQDIYSFAKPIRLPAGSRIDVWASYDNTSANHFNPNNPPQPVSNGWATTDEMMLVSFTALLDNPKKENKLWSEVIKCYMRSGVEKIK
ncbi:MAG: hypothetical protein L3J39_02860 [Verrucomicrobiales bacterium]|nr:hypothetical protein [Verrucomicrobiales bacterium]